MSLSLWVQFFRNLFCVGKSLLPASNFLQQIPFPHAQFYPLTLTTAVELLIAPTQFAAVIFNCRSGYFKLEATYPLLAKYRRWLRALDVATVTTTSPSFNHPAACIMRQGLEADLNAAFTAVVVGGFEVVFGVAFLFLVLNSLHIVGPTHPKPLIDALIAMEVGLAYILVLMWRAYTDKRRDGPRYARLADAVAAFAPPLTTAKVLGGVVEAGFSDGDLFHALCLMEGLADPAYTPCWRPAPGGTTTITPTPTPGAAAGPSDVEVKQEVSKIAALVGKLASDTADAKAARQRCAEALRRQAAEATLQAPLELVYFWLNFVAGYGYLLGVLAYYIPQDVTWCRVLMFGLSHEAADWWGNLFGDTAWTVEPVLLLANGALIARWMRQRAAVEAKNK